MLSVTIRSSAYSCFVIEDWLILFAGSSQRIAWPNRCSVCFTTTRDLCLSTNVKVLCLWKVCYFLKGFIFFSWTEVNHLIVRSTSVESVIFQIWSVSTITPSSEFCSADVWLYFVSQGNVLKCFNWCWIDVFRWIKNWVSCFYHWAKYLVIIIKNCRVNRWIKHWINYMPS